MVPRQHRSVHGSGRALSSYIGANFNNDGGPATDTISNWLLTPPITLQNGGQLVFWTRTVDVPAFPDRLQVRMSTNGTSSNVGTTPTDVGDFTTLLLDINPTYTMTGYPNVWTQFTVTISGLGLPIKGRLAFRYFVENGGPAGVNSDYIGIDSVHRLPRDYQRPPTPTPTPTPTASPTPTPMSTPAPTPTPEVSVFPLSEHATHPSGAVYLGPGQQRNLPRRQQLLESVLHGDVRGREHLLRDLG